MRVYTLEQVNEIIDLQNWSSCLCKNELNGIECKGADTIQVSIDSDSAYFGEFFGNSEKDQYEFIFYIN
jgi:hypothetical protein